MENSGFKNEDYYVSFYDTEAEVLGSLKPPKKIELHDVTLRDGEQQARITFRKHEKLQIAEALMDAGVDRVEAGMPSVSANDSEAVKAVAHLGKGSKVYAFGRCMKADVDKALETDVDGIVMEIPSSEHLIKLAYGWDVEKAVRLSAEATKYAHDHGLKVTFFTIDATRAPFETFWKIAGKVIEEGHMDSFALADTFGVLNPHASMFFIKKIRELTNKPIEIHAHNDFGLANANSIFAVLGGASTVHVSLTGIGERSGNAAMEEVVMALKSLYGVDSSVDTRSFRNMATLVRKLSGVNFSPQKAIVGDDIFTIESGILASWWKRLEPMKLPLEMFPFMPGYVGHDGVDIILGKKSGIDSILYKADKFGIDIDQKKAESILMRVKDLALARKGNISDEELKVLMKD